MTRTQKEKMLAGELYNAADPEIQADLLATGVWLKRYNHALGQSPEQWHALLSERLAEVGPGAVIRPPFHCDYGFNIRLGANAFLNFNCVILDVVEVTIGEGAQIGPAVQIYTAAMAGDPHQPMSYAAYEAALLRASWDAVRRSRTLPERSGPSVAQIEGGSVIGARVPNPDEGDPSGKAERQPDG